MQSPTRHVPTGFLLALSTAILWGCLPIALKMLLSRMDSVTITLYRFFAAVILVGGFLYLRGALPSWKQFNRTTLFLMLIAIGGLVGNYVVFLLGLRFITPDASQVLIQLGPMFFLLGSVFFFKEQFRPVQWLGFAVLMIGLVLFFHHRIEELIFNWSDYGIGLIFIVIAAAIWAAYALAQKKLMAEMAPAQILFGIYLIGVLILLPMSTPSSVGNLNAFGWGLLIFSSINTVLAYTCFAEAQRYMESSRVSAVITLTPLFTLLFSTIAMKWIPEFTASERVDWKSALGAILVVLGSMRTVLVRSVEVETPGEPPAESFGSETNPVYDEVSVTPTASQTTS